MKPNRTLLLVFILMIVVAALYRVIPSRPMGFAPQLAMALFAGAMIKDRKWAFALPVFSLFLSDLLYQALYLNGLSTIPGLYEGQVTNYLLICAMVAVGFWMKKISPLNVLLFSLLESVLYFLASNFVVWINSWGFSRPKTFNGLLLCYSDALPFFRNSVISTIVFSAVLFGAYHLLANRKTGQATLASR